MKRLLIASLALALSMGLFAQTSGTGIGARVGTGIDFSLKMWTGETTALQLDAGLDYSGWMGVHADGSYLIHSWSWGVGQDEMKVYFGPGVGLGVYFYEDWDYSRGYYTHTNFSFGIRAPSGVAYYFHSIPLECFVELTPGIDLYNGGFFNDWGHWGSFVGAHWYF